MVIITKERTNAPPSARRLKNVRPDVQRFRSQLLKWIGNKQRFAHEIVGFFPARYGTYFEPFLGSGAVLGTLAPKNAVASDNFGDLIGIWQMLRNDPERLKRFTNVGR